MDIFGIIGLVLGFGAAIGGYMLEGGHFSSLLILSPFIIVFGGSLGATLLSFSVGDVAGAFGAVIKSFFAKDKALCTDVIEKVSNIANVCRADGLLKLQTLCEQPQFNDPDFLILKEGMVLALDMKGADEIEEALAANIEAFTTQRTMQAGVFGTMAGLFPTLGVTGTVMGLVHVLGNMSDPESLVGSIGAAFIATLYGVGFANLIWMPFSSRIKNMLKRETIARQMMMEGICMVVKGETARSIGNKLSAYYQAFPGGQKLYQEGISK